MGTHKRKIYRKRSSRRNISKNKRTFKKKYNGSGIFLENNDKTIADDDVCPICLENLHLFSFKTPILHEIL